MTTYAIMALIGGLMAAPPPQSDPARMAETASVAIGQDRAGNRLETLSDPQTGLASCTDDEVLCLSVVQKDEASVLRFNVDGAAPQDIDLPEAEDERAFAVWPYAVRGTDRNWLIGVTQRTTAMYSGGGGSALELHLFSVGGTSEPSPVLVTPIQSHVMIRACFSEEDMEKRLGACHDEYGFATSLSLDETVTSGRPVILYQTRATAFPSGSSRNEDSSTREPLTQANLAASEEERCTFSRRLAWDAAEGLYRPDLPVADCSDFTQP